MSDFDGRAGTYAERGHPVPLAAQVLPGNVVEQRTT